MNDNRRWCVALRTTLFFICAVHGSLATAQSVAPEKLAKVRRATVYIYNDKGEGTGFIIQCLNRTAIVATAAHVVCDQRGNRYQPPKVVLNSGTPDEQTLKARIIGYDVRRDLAFLEVRSQELPEPIYLAPDATVIETMDVVIAGYPYGGQLAVGRENPQLSISKGAVSSVRSGATASAAVIQLDANINPGNSGGPVLNAAGDVIGLVQSKVDGTSLGFALPAHYIVSGLMGNVCDIAASSSSNLTFMRVEARLIDPLRRIGRVTLVAGSATSIPSLDLRTNKSWPQIPHKFQLPLSTGGDPIGGDLNLPIEGIPVSDTAVQLICERADGTVENSPPMLIEQLLAARDKAQEQPQPRESPVPPRSGAPSRESRPEVELTVKATREKMGTLTGSSTQVSSGILSSPIKLGEYEVRRVMIPRTRYAPRLWWSSSGDNLVVAGEQTCVIDFPSARDIKTYKLLDANAWSHLRGMQLLHQVNGNRFQAIDLANGAAYWEWELNEAARATALVNSNAWLISSIHGNSVYLLDEKSSRLNKIDLPFQNTSGGNGEFYVAGSEGLLFERFNDQLKRYKFGRGQTVTEESVNLGPVATGFPALLPTSDSQILLLLSNSQSLTNRASLVLAYAAQNLTRKFQVAVPDHIRCVVRDTKRSRLIMSGLDTIWFWHPSDGRLLSQPFLKSAPAIDAIALHPTGKMLAILCGGKGSSSSLYWLDLEPTETPSR